MPRLTATQYLHQRNALRVDWFDDQAWTFSHLDSLAEMELHAYFAPVKDFTDEQALAHRVKVTRENPSLPQQAGRAFKRATVFLGTRPEPKPLARIAKQKRQQGHVTVRTVGQPELDFERLARALVRMARDGGRQDGDTTESSR